MKNKNQQFFCREETPTQENENRFIKQSNGFIIAFFVVTNNITGSDGLCYKLINSSIQQEFFLSQSKYEP